MKGKVMFDVDVSSQQTQLGVALRGVVASRATKDSRVFSGKNQVVAAALLMLVVSVGHAFGQNKRDSDFRFVNVADSTQGFTAFSTFPAINNDGAVAFQARGPALTDEGVFRWQDGTLRTIAKHTVGGPTLFGIDPVINAAGTVAFEANLSTGARAIFTSDGVTTKTIVNTIDQGLIGRFLGSPSIDRFGTVAFFGVRNGFISQAVFTGNGGALTPVVDTIDSNFAGFQNVAINASGKIVFAADNNDGSVGLFVIDKDDPLKQPSLIVDTNNPDFGGFGDPVINKHGTIADDAFRNDGNAEILSGDRHGVTARTDIAGATFIQFEHPSINDSDAVAFFAFKADGGSGVFIELTGAASPIPVIQTGDALFGSTVTEVDLGRFALNNKFQLAFQYTLADGRSGVAIASLRRDEGRGDRQDDDE
jgi:hypothetical protein